MSGNAKMLQLVEGEFYQFEVVGRGQVTAPRRVLVTPNANSSAVPKGTAGGAIPAGYAVCHDSSGTRYVVASDANVTAFNGWPVAVALTAAAANGDTFDVGRNEIPSSVTGLGTGDRSYVGVDSSGALVRQSNRVNSLGVCDQFGNLFVNATPSGFSVTPDQIEDLYSWYRGDSMTNDGGTISAVVDKAGNRDLTISGGPPQLPRGTGRVWRKTGMAVHHLGDRDRRGGIGLETFPRRHRVHGVLCVSMHRNNRTARHLPYEPRDVGAYRFGDAARRG